MTAPDFAASKKVCSASALGRIHSVGRDLPLSALSHGHVLLMLCSLAGARSPLLTLCASQRMELKKLLALGEFVHDAQMSTCSSCRCEGHVWSRASWK